METFSTILTIAGISIIIFLITLLISDISKNKSKVLLVIILIAFIPLFLSYNLTITQTEELLFSILPFTSLSLIIIGPLLYEYAFQFFNANHKVSFKEKRKYYPFFLCSTLLAISYTFLSSQIYFFILITTISFSFIYLFYYLVVLIKYQLKVSKKLKYFYASLSDKNLFWVNILIIGLSFALVLDSISGVIIAMTGFAGIPIINTFFLLTLIWIIGYYSLTQGRITHNIDEYKIPSHPKIEPNFFNEKEFQELEIRLEIVMSDKELYKLEQINLAILSQQLETSVKKTSYLLNHCMNTTFYDLINKYRIEAFKSKVKNGELREKTIIGLAFESGFNSKATFNRIFKLKEGITPNQYKKNNTK